MNEATKYFLLMPVNVRGGDREGDTTQGRLRSCTLFLCGLWSCALSADGRSSVLSAMPLAPVQTFLRSAISWPSASQYSENLVMAQTPRIVPQRQGECP